MQIEAARGGKRPRPNMAELAADPWLGIFRQWDLPALDVQHRRLAPAKTVAEIQVERPVARQLRTCVGFDGGAGFGLAVDAGGKPVGALALDRAIDRHRAIDPV